MNRYTSPLSLSLPVYPSPDVIARLGIASSDMFSETPSHEVRRRARADYETGQCERALLGFRHLISLHEPGFPAYDDSADENDQSADMKSNDFVWLGATFSNLSLHESALLAHTAAIEIRPAYAEAYYHRAILHGAAKRFELSLRDFSLAIRLKPKYPQAYNHRGCIYDDNKEFKRAIEDYSIAIQQDSGYYEALNNRGFAWANLGA